MEDINNTILNFWVDRKEYPNYPNTLIRRYMDLSFVLQKISDDKSLLDIGCADGSMLLALREFTEIDTFYGYDFSRNLLDILKKKWGRWPGLVIKQADIKKLKIYPEVDITIALGVFPYIVDDLGLNGVLNKIRSDTLLVRAPCSLNKSREIINKFSKELGTYYAAVYRTVQEYIVILSNMFVVHEVNRAYPDAIESKYGTKHFWFVCRRG